MTHEVRQGASEAGLRLKLETGNAACPRKGVAHRGHACVQWTGVLSAVTAASVFEGEGAGGAALRRLCKPLDAWRAQGLAGPTVANLAKAGNAQHVLHLNDITPFWVEAQRNVCEGRSVDNRVMTETLTADCPPTLDPVASARWAAWPHATSPWLNEEIGRRMEDRLQWIRLQPTSWVDWAPVSGGLKTHQLLRTRYNEASCAVVEPTPAREYLAREALQAPWWKRLFNQNALSFGAPAAGSADMLWANMAIHTTEAPQALLRQWHQLLRVDGFLMFSCLGPDTLRELDAIYQNLGWPPAHHDFTDMHDWGDMLVQAGFAEPVMDMERITLTYDSPERLLAELRHLGRNFHRKRFAALRGHGWYEKLLQALWQLASPNHEGRLVLTVEVIYGHAVKPSPKIKVAGETVVALQDMRGMLKANPAANTHTK